MPADVPLLCNELLTIYNTVPPFGFDPLRTEAAGIRQLLSQPGGLETQVKYIHERNKFLRLRDEVLAYCGGGNPNVPTVRTSFQNAFSEWMLLRAAHGL
jgi:hypothetical protein